MYSGARYISGCKFEEYLCRLIRDTAITDTIIIPNFKFYSSVLGYSPQIDLLVLNKYGVYCIEAKNISGKLEGKFNDTIWTSYSKYYVNSLQNPIKQNRTHIDALRFELRLKFGKSPLIKNIVCVNKECLFDKDISFPIHTPTSLLKLLYNDSKKKKANKKFKRINTKELYYYLRYLGT